MLTYEQRKKFDNLMKKEYASTIYFKDNRWYGELSDLGIKTSEEELACLFFTLYDLKQEKFFKMVNGL